MYLSPAVSYRILTDNPGKTEALLIRPDAPLPPPHLVTVFQNDYF